MLRYLSSSGMMQEAGVCSGRSFTPAIRGSPIRNSPILVNNGIMAGIHAMKSVLRQGTTVHYRKEPDYKPVITSIPVHIMLILIPNGSIRLPEIKTGWQITGLMVK